MMKAKLRESAGFPPMNRGIENKWKEDVIRRPNTYRLDQEIEDVDDMPGTIDDTEDNSPEDQETESD